MATRTKRTETTVEPASDAVSRCQHPSFREDGVCTWCVGYYEACRDKTLDIIPTIFDCEQNSEEWYAARAGVITASEFATVKAQGKTPGTPSVTRRKYMLTLIGEQIAGGCSPFDRYKNGHMERGHAFEDEAREYYTFVTDAEVIRVGFIRRGDIGWSPDGLIGDDGALEIKTKQYDLHLECLLQDRIPPEHLPQLQGGMLVSGRKWIDFISHSPGLPTFIKRCYRDESYIAMLNVELARFRSDMADLLQKVRGMAA